MARDRVLVTGSGGFVGGYITDLLERAGYETWGVDRAPGLPQYRGSKYIARDLQEKSSVDDVLRQARPRYIVHLAAQSSAGMSFSKPHETIANNIMSALHILEFLRTSELEARLLVAGSADVYGPVAREDLPLRETMPANPNNPYALSKTVQEQCCTLYAGVYGVDVVSTRSFNHTGAGRPDTFVLSSFAKQIIEIKKGSREPVVEVGDLEVRRDFSDVRDVVRAYLLLLEKGRAGEVYNVCSGSSRSLREVLEKLIELAGVHVEIRVADDRLRPADMEELRGDYSKLEADTGWRPEIPFEDTLVSLLDYWDKSLSETTTTAEDSE